jgi:hypothetical protein
MRRVANSILPPNLRWIPSQYPPAELKKISPYPTHKGGILAVTQPIPNAKKVAVRIPTYGINAIPIINKNDRIITIVTISASGD